VRWALGIVIVCICAGDASGAQQVGAADSALSAGDITRADSLYYAAVRFHPRDPVAREALGNYLAKRGASRVASVLLEEARLFGADAARIAAELVPLYQSQGDWRALLTLQSSPLGYSERRRAAWFAGHPPATVVDSTSQVLVGPPKGDTLARVATHVGERTAMAVILAEDVGVVIGSRIAGGAAQSFPGGDNTVIALDSMRVGGARFTNVAARLGDVPGVVTIGMAGFGGLMPTFDYANNRFAFNRQSVAAPLARLPFLRDHGELRVLDRGRWIGLSEFASEIAKARQSFTIDFRAGEIIVQP
jgi:hypothetical protein